MNPILIQSIHSYFLAEKGKIHPDSSLYISLPTPDETAAITMQFNMDFLYPQEFDMTMMRYIIQTNKVINFPKWLDYAKNSDLHFYQEYDSQVKLYENFLSMFKEYLPQHRASYMAFMKKVIEEHYSNNEYYYYLNIEYQRVHNFTQQILTDIQDIAESRFIPNEKPKLFYTNEYEEEKIFTQNSLNALTKDFFYKHLDNQLSNSHEISIKSKI